MIVHAETDDERAPLPRTDDTTGLAGRDGSDRIRPLEFRHGKLHRAQQVAVGRAVPMRVHEMRNHFGVGLRAEFVALRFQAFAQRLVIFDDAVVDDRDFIA